MGTSINPCVEMYGSVSSIFAYGLLGLFAFTVVFAITFPCDASFQPNAS